MLSLLLVSCLGFKVGDFTITYTADSQSLLVVHDRKPAQVVWKTIPNQNFVTAASVKETVVSSGGRFVFDEISRHVCNDQAITRVGMEADQLVLYGSLCNAKVEFTLAFAAIPESKNQVGFSLSIQDPTSTHNRVGLRYGLGAAERVHGFGEQFTVSNFKGRRVRIFTQEKGVGHGLQPLTDLLNLATPGAGGTETTSYTAIPHYLTSTSKSLYLTSEETATFDVGSVAMTVEANHTLISGRMISADSPADIIFEYTIYAGRMKQLPKWVNRGAIISTGGGSDKVRAALSKLRALAPDTPIAALWLQDWCGQRQFPDRVGVWWNWEVDYDLYPDWEKLVAELRAQKIRMLTYINPMLADMTHRTPKPPRDLLAIARAQGFLVKTKDGKEWVGYDGAGLVDLLNPKARDWFTGLIKGMIAAGSSGWMADFGESYPLDPLVSSASGDALPADALHNSFPYSWHLLNQHAVNDSEVVYWVRSASTRSPGASSLFWQGDQLISWDGFDGLRSSVKSMLSSSLSGFSLSHSDIGGYARVQQNGPGFSFNYTRTPELLMRWAELAAFQPFFRTHQSSDILHELQVWQDAKVAQHLEVFAQAFAAMEEYRVEFVAEAAARGLPLCRPLLLEFPSDPTSWAVEDEFLMGTDLLVAPVLDQNATARFVYLPPGRWMHVWTNTSYGGPAGVNLSFAAPLGQPPVFASEALFGTPHPRPPQRSLLRALDLIRAAYVVSSA